MAAKPLNREVVDNILIDWRLGQLSQRKIADKYGVSNGVVAKITKGIDRDVSSIVSAGIKYQQDLHTHDERIVSAVEKVVDEAASRMEWLNKAALKNVEEAMKSGCENQQDFKHRADTVLKAKEAVFGKIPDVSINNTNAQQNNRTITFEVVRPSIQS